MTTWGFVPLKVSVAALNNDHAFRHDSLQVTVKKPKTVTAPSQINLLGLWNPSGSNIDSRINLASKKLTQSTHTNG